MNDKQLMSTTLENKYDEDMMRRAAYALNMCAVSVAQIVDYNDEYILEQEYEAILNNLNLKEIPDDEAFLKILTELLNTISFFRIQEKKKKKIEKKYQKQMKDAIWSAVPNIGMIVANPNPAVMAISLATQVGTGYMNYRKEKAKIGAEKEDQEFELELVALEQFNAIQRELFTTAWRIAKEYKFPDNYRITEKQIKQYNAILMDADEQRRFIRLEALKDDFYAYPPFWYYLAHTASSIAGSEEFLLDQKVDEEFKKYERDIYIQKAKEYFEEYYKMNKYNILREDQITASFALEYVELLLAEEPTKENRKKVQELLEVAVKKSGCALDIMQICAVIYLKIGDLDKAADLLKQLVNEGINVTTNAKLLSKVYATQFLSASKENENIIRMNYHLLQRRVSKDYLYPMPNEKGRNNETMIAELNGQFVNTQKEYLNYISADMITGIKSHMAERFDEILLPFDQLTFVEKTEKGKKFSIPQNNNQRAEVDKYIKEYAEFDFKSYYLSMFNQMVNVFDVIAAFQSAPNKDEWLSILREAIKESAKNIDEIVELFKSEDDSKYVRLHKISEEMKYETLTQVYWKEIEEFFSTTIREMGGLDEIEQMISEIHSVCEKENIALTELEVNEVNGDTDYSKNEYFENDILGEEYKKQKQEQKETDSNRKRLAEVVKKYTNKAQIVIDESKAKMLLSDMDEFDNYFDNNAFTKKSLKNSTFAILDDRSIFNEDLLFTVNGIVVVKRNQESGTYKYDDIQYKATGSNAQQLVLGGKYVYKNAMFTKVINIEALNGMINEIKSKVR